MKCLKVKLLLYWIGDWITLLILWCGGHYPVKDLGIKFWSWYCSWGGIANNGQIIIYRLNHINGLVLIARKEMFRYEHFLFGLCLYSFFKTYFCFPVVDHGFNNRWTHTMYSLNALYVTWFMLLFKMETIMMMCVVSVSPSINMLMWHFTAQRWITMTFS